MSQNSEDLVFLPRPKFLRQRPIMLLTDCPLDVEIKAKASYSSQSAASLFRDLGKVNLTRGFIHASYIFPFRPDRGDISSLFYYKGLTSDDQYASWPMSKKDKIVNYAYNELLTLKHEIQEVKPSMIICAGKWALYFLTGETTFTETKRSPFGTLLKWRGSHLQLTDFWEYETEHVLIPILPPSSLWQLPEMEVVCKQDNLRLAKVGKAALAGDVSEFVTTQDNFLTAPTFEQARNWFHSLLIIVEENAAKNQITPVAFDVETSNGFEDCISIAYSDSDAMCLPFSTTDSPHYWNEVHEFELYQLLRTLMLHPNVGHIGQNYSYDMQYFWRDLFIKVQPMYDTMVQHHTLFAGMEKNLAFLASLYCKVYKYWKDEGKLAKGKTSQERWIYGCKDVCRTFEIHLALREIYSMAPKQLQEAFEFQNNELVPALVDIMNRGVRVRETEKQRLYKELTEVMVVLEQELTEAIGEPFNPKSSDQKKALFYDLFGCPVQFDPKTGKPTLSAEALDIIKEAEPLVRGFADRVAEYGNLNTFSSTFLKARVDEDGRMRTAYNPCGTDTFRLSSRQNAFGSGANLQNLPTGGKTALGHALPNIRSLFLADIGMMFFDIDLDSADLRIVVAESGAKNLKQMFKEKKKPYIELMKEFYHDPTKDKNSPEYKIFKGLCHGTNYLGSAKGLAARLGLLVHEVDRIQKWYLGANPEIRQWHKELENQVTKRGWIENIFGYRKFFFNKREPTLMQIAAAWKPQSTVGILINKGMVNLRHNESDVQVLLQVHDSLAGQFPKNKPYLADNIVKRCMIELPYEEPITIPVDIHLSETSWGGCK